MHRTRSYGYLRIEGGPEGLVEENTIKCVHCQLIGYIQGRQVYWPKITEKRQDFFTCRMCYSDICPTCANKPCRHFEKWLEAVEKKGSIYYSRLEKLQDLAYKAARASGLV